MRTLTGLGMAVVAVAMAAGITTAQHPQPSTWRLIGAQGVARVSAAAAQPVTLTAGEPQQLSFVEAQVDFPWYATGKPGSLVLTVPPGNEVVIAVDAAPPETLREIALAALAALATRGGEHRWALRTSALDEAAASDYRIVADVDVGEGDTAHAVGLVARHGEHGCYVFVVDPLAAVVRIERWFGADRMVVAQQVMGTAPVGAHTLTFQLQGFRLQCFLDGRSVLQVFDGGLQRGGIGLAWPNGMSAGSDSASIRLGAPAAPRPSMAVVIGTGLATFYCATAAQPGSLHVLELSQDRPGPPLPLDGKGLEPWLLQAPALPRVMLADWRDSLGGNTIGEVPFSGDVTVELRWPLLPALRHRVVLGRLLLVNADGDAITGDSPVVPILW